MHIWVVESRNNDQRIWMPLFERFAIRQDARLFCRRRNLVFGLGNYRVRKYVRV